MASASRRLPARSPHLPRLAAGEATPESPLPLRRGGGRVSALRRQRGLAAR
jgi:hypothetical protein